MSETFVPTADLKKALINLAFGGEPQDPEDTVRRSALPLVMKALGLKTLAADPFDGALDQQRLIDEAEGYLTALANAGDAARGAITEVEVPLAALPVNWPETWEGKPFAKVGWDGEDNGEPFLCIGADQAGTILGEFLGGRTVEAARARLLQAMFLGGLTAQELVLHECQDTPLFQQADYQARIAVGGELPHTNYAPEPITLEDYASACRKAALDFVDEPGMMQSRAWEARADEAERRITAGERYL